MGRVHILNIAFDGKSSEELITFLKKQVEVLGGEVFNSWKVLIKVNDLLSEIGLQWLREIQNNIKDALDVDIHWMLDPKWFDIPNTVWNNANRLDGLNIQYYTVHASWGPEMIKEAKKRAHDKKLLAITVLTSMKEYEIRDLYRWTRDEVIIRLAKSALWAGADGLVCSPADAPMLREVFGNDFLLVTPNIQREWVERNDDQNRALTNTPRWAIENGSSDVVVGRPILTSDNPGEVIYEMLEQMDSAVPQDFDNGEFMFEKLLHTSNWGALLKYIWAVYERPENGKYTRFASGMIADLYFNNWLLERDYRVIDGISHHLASQIRDHNISADIIIGAQMWSVRLSLWLASALGIRESLYVEKVGEDGISLKRHDLWVDGLRWKKIVLSEDVVTKWSTVAKIMKLVRDGGGEVVAIDCIVNRSNQDNFNWIPIFECYIAPQCGMWWDTETLRKTRENESIAGKSEEEIVAIINSIQSNNPHIPEDAEISEKPKNEWNSLVESMR